MSCNKNIKTEGFTLIEILIAICIFTSILGVILYFGFNISGLNSFLSENMISQSELQLTLNSMLTELRSMGPSGVGGYPIQSATGSSLTFFSDLDRDGVFERIRYWVSGSVLMRGVIKPTGNPLTYNPANEKTTEAVHYIISNPSSVFSYYAKKYTIGDTPMTAPISPILVRSIKADLTVDRLLDAEPGPVTYKIFATIRNFRMNQ